ncbi:MAG: hypothetical protein F6K04_02750 [Leptolyngbya sp. SIO4C5]|nr:hypothetical protein [Leptolyngbya sp. SIO4C5]
MLREYGFLSLAQIYAALTYYCANQAEIEAYLVVREMADYDCLIAQGIAE